MGRLSSGSRTLFVTGHRGFIGSHFTEQALAQGHRVIGIDKLTYAANGPGTLMFSDGLGITEHFIDINDLQEVPACDAIINFAAESHVDNSITGNDVFMRSNVLGVHRLLELVKNQKIANLMHSWAYEPPLFVQVSTDEVFGDIEAPGAFKEDDRHMPSNPYSATKSAAEQLVVAWGRTYGLPYIITRTTNNYGPRQHPEKLIPKTISNLLSGRKAIVHGSGSYVRNWVHVLDNVDALFRIIDRGEVGQAYHVSSDEELSVKDVVMRVCQELGLRYDDWVDSSSDRSGADVRYALDSSRVRALGWKPAHGFSSSISALCRRDG